MSSTIPLLCRRQFVRLSALAAAAFAGLGACAQQTGAINPAPVSAPDAGTGVGSDAAADAGGDSAPDAFVSPELPSLGGAPDTPQGRTIAAFVDCVVPSRYRDPTGAPGALDVDAAALFFDPELPAAAFVGVLALLLDSQAKKSFDGRAFVELVPAQRDQVLDALLAGPSPLEFAVQLAKLAYFSSDEAAEHLGYPGPNTGYIGHPDFGFGVALTTEITPDGNLA
jgi:hypothetical protein